jgi:hypothetical protein
VLRTDYASHTDHRRNSFHEGYASTINGESEKGGHSLTSGPCRMPETAMLNYTSAGWFKPAGRCLSCTPLILVHKLSCYRSNAMNSMLAKMLVIRIRPFWFDHSNFVVSKNKHRAYLLRASISYGAVRISTKQEWEPTSAGLIMPQSLLGQRSGTLTMYSDQWRECSGVKFHSLWQRSTKVWAIVSPWPCPFIGESFPHLIPYHWSFLPLVLICPLILLFYYDYLW